MSQFAQLKSQDSILQFLAGVTLGLLLIVPIGLQIHADYPQHFFTIVTMSWLGGLSLIQVGRTARERSDRRMRNKRKPSR